MVAPRLISCLPSFGNAAGGESVTIAGLDIDPAATVDFFPFPGWPSGVPLPAAVTGYIFFPNGVQHITVASPAIPTQSGTPGDLTFANRDVTIRVTNPPYGEFDELENGWDARFIDRTPTFVEVGTVLFFPERLLEPIGGGALFESFTEHTNLHRQTYQFTASAGGLVEYKAFNPVPPFTHIRHEFGGYDYAAPYVSRGKIVRVVLEGITTTAGWSARFFDDVNIDTFKGEGLAAGPAVGAIDFVPSEVDGYGDSSPVWIDDWMRLSITGAGAGGTGKVHVYLATE